MATQQTDLLVNLYSDPDGEPDAVNVPLGDAFPDPDDYRAARNALEMQGQWWTGGGASPVCFIALAD